MDNMRKHVARCFDMDMTDSLARHHANPEMEPLRRISQCKDLERLDKALMRQSNKHGGDGGPASLRFNFWGVHKWRRYIDRVLGDDDQDGPHMIDKKSEGGNPREN